MNWSRRTVIWTLGAGTGVTALGIAGWSTGFIPGKHYPPTPYDDLLVQLRDREAAVRMGQEVLKSLPNLETSAAANTVRARLISHTFNEAVAMDSENGRLLEVRGWVVPETLALLSAVAARV